MIYNLFTGDVNFLEWRRYLGWQCDVINAKSFHEIMTYLFQILATPLRTIANLQQCYENIITNNKVIGF